MIVPRDTASNRPIGVNGMIRYNTNLAKFEVYENDNWVNMVGGGAADNLGNHTATSAILAITGTAASPSYSFNGDTDTGLWAVGPNQIAASTGGTERVRVGSNGYVGIGTTSPTELVDVNGRLKAAQVCIGGTCRSDWPTGGASSDLIVQSLTFSASSGTPGNASDELSNTEWRAPASALTHWWGVDFGTNKTVIRYVIDSGGVENDYISDLYFEASATGAWSGEEVLLDTWTSPNLVDDAIGQERSVTNSTGYRYYRLRMTLSSARRPAWAEVHMYENAAAIQWTLNGSQLYYNSGNVGIGTTTPAARLDIFATGTGGGSALIVPRDTTAFRPTGVNGMIRYNTNNAKFEVYENDNWVNMVTGTVAGDNLGNHTATSAILAVTGTAATPSYSFGAGSNRGLYAVGTGGVAFSTSSLERLRIDDNGNVGIGTANPTTKLSVGDGTGTTVITVDGAVGNNKGLSFKDGGAYVGQFIVASGNTWLDRPGSLFVRNSAGSATHLTIDGPGNVGIGTTTPGARLDVYGTGSASAAIVPRDDTANRPTGINGMIRYNTNLAKFEAYENNGWVNMINSGGGSGNIQSPITPTATLGASCSTVGQLATNASGDLLVCDDTPTTLQGTSCTDVGALTFDIGGNLYVCLN